MSATVTAPPRNVLELVRSLSDEEKELAFAELWREAIEISGDKYAIPMETADGRAMGFLVPPTAAEGFPLLAQFMKLTPEQRSGKALENLDDTFDMAEFLDELNEADRG